MHTQEQLRKALFNAIVIRDDVYAIQETNGTYHPVRKPFTSDIYTDNKQTVGSYLLKISTCKNYHPERDKEYNNNKVAGG